jgi:hypothetical protein
MQQIRDNQFVVVTCVQAFGDGIVHFVEVIEIAEYEPVAGLFHGLDRQIDAVALRDLQYRLGPYCSFQVDM